MILGYPGLPYLGLYFPPQGEDETPIIRGGRVRRPRGRSADAVDTNGRSARVTSPRGRTAHVDDPEGR